MRRDQDELALIKGDPRSPLRCPTHSVRGPLTAQGHGSAQVNRGNEERRGLSPSALRVNQWGAEFCENCASQEESVVSGVVDCRV